MLEVFLLASMKAARYSSARATAICVGRPWGFGPRDVLGQLKLFITHVGMVRG